MGLTTQSQSAITKSVIDSVRNLGREVSFMPGASVVRRGESGHSFYVVVSGEVEILLGNDGAQLTLARLGGGSSFGEMALLTGEPVSADVVARSETVLFELAEDNFKEAMSQSTTLRDHVLTRLANNLHRTNSETWGLFQDVKALNALMNTTDSKTGEIVAESSPMQRAYKKVVDIAADWEAIMIQGEPGTGKLFMAKKIHALSRDADSPLIVVDCSDIEKDKASKLLFGTTDLASFVDGLCESNEVDLEFRGALHIADKGTLVLRHVDLLDDESQDLLAGYIKALGDSKRISPLTRIICTSRKDIAKENESGLLSQALVEKLSNNIIKMPSMRSRKKDIIPLAKLFLSESAKQKEEDERLLNQSAEHTLVSQQYEHANVAELREAVEFATLISDELEIDSSHIFTGPKTTTHSIELDLGESSPVKWLLHGKTTLILQAAMLLFFAGLAIICLSWPGSFAANVTNIMVWGLWWPSLMIMFLLAGRVWCMLCPISSVGKIAQHFGSLKIKPPEWLKDNSPWLVALSFLAIIWSEHVFDMLNSPFATGILFIALMAISALCCLVFQREVWCRYLCPLGGLGAAYSVSSMVHIRANPDVCSSQCKTHECFKGTGTFSGCPVFHHPLFIREAHFCKMCLECMRACPHQSPKPYVRPPLQGVWRVDDLSPALVTFAVVVFFQGLVTLAAPRLGWTQSLAGYTALSLMAFTAAVWLGAVLPGFLTRESNMTVASRIAFGMLMLGWGPFTAFHIEHIPGLDLLRLYFVEHVNVLDPTVQFDISLLTILQTCIISIVALFAAITMWRIWKRCQAQGTKLLVQGWVILGFICIMYLVTAIVLVTLPGKVS